MKPRNFRKGFVSIELIINSIILTSIGLFLSALSYQAVFLKKHDDISKLKLEAISMANIALKKCMSDADYTGDTERKDDVVIERSCERYSNGVLKGKAKVCRDSICFERLSYGEI